MKRNIILSFLLALGVLSATGCGSQKISSESVLVFNDRQEHYDYIVNHQVSIDSELNKFDQSLNHDDPKLTETTEEHLENIRSLAEEYLEFENVSEDTQAGDESYKEAMSSIISFVDKALESLENGTYLEDDILSELLEYISKSAKAEEELF